CSIVVDVLLQIPVPHIFKNLEHILIVLFFSFQCSNVILIVAKFLAAISRQHCKFGDYDVGRVEPVKMSYRLILRMPIIKEMLFRNR
ncbi:AAEL013013-PA, partial [Aedes aegypti]